jgi:hypothetical protein
MVRAPHADNGREAAPCWSRSRSRRETPVLPKIISARSDLEAGGLKAEVEVELGQFLELLAQ